MEVVSMETSDLMGSVTRQATQQLTGGALSNSRIWENSIGSRIGPLTDLGSACAQQGVKLWYPQPLTDRRPVLKAQVMLLH